MTDTAEVVSDAATTQTAGGLVEFADLSVDFGRRVVARDGREISLGKLSFKLLQVLIDAAPNIVTHDQLVERVWDGRDTSPETITQRIKLLRDAIDDDAAQPRYISLIRGEGYRLLPEVISRPAAPAPHQSTLSRLVPGFAAVAVIVGIAVAILLWSPPSQEQRPPSRAIAVLPLNNFSGNPNLEYFADGMTEALISGLAQLPDLTVISRTSVMPYKNTNKKTPDIAKELNVGAIIEGSAQLEGNRVRITAQLIDGETDHHIWADEYDRDLSDILNLQKDIARDIAKAVSIQLAPNNNLITVDNRQVDPDSYRAYLEGMYHLNKSTPEGIQQGIEILHQAVEKNPASAHAWAGLALGYTTIGHGPNTDSTALLKASEAAERALIFDPNLAEAHAAMADVKLYLEWDWQGAEESFLRANALNPNLAMNHYHYAWYLALFERYEEALYHHRLAARIDPLTALHSGWLGAVHLYDDPNRYPEAIADATQALATFPNDPAAHLVMGLAYDMAGEYEQALPYHQYAAKTVPLFRFGLGLSHARAGRLDEVKKLLNQVEQEPLSAANAYLRANLHFALGEIDAGFDMLQYEPHHAFVPWIKVDPNIKPIVQDHPQFQVFLKRLALAP